jgi:signal recognition particle receptor subunit alpha
LFFEFSKKLRSWGNDDPDYVPDEPVTASRGESKENPARASAPEVLKEIKFDEPIDEDSDSDDDEQDESTQKRGFFSRYLPSLTGKTLTRDDLAPLMEQYQNHLISKNVASAIAENLCDSVTKSLEGSHLSTFASAKNLVKQALTDSLTRILTPKRQVDILNDIDRTNQQGKPYSIVFVGVNGVGKSTSLSKISSWLLQNKKSVLIAACDTFRSGAVEQLKVHADRLNVPVFEQGYSSDPSNVAKFAIKKADQDKTNVVLIDTAGRMQDNEPLMLALSNVCIFIIFILSIFHLYSFF